MMVTDPVCGAALDTDDRALADWTVGGRSRYFCSTECLFVFVRDVGRDPAAAAPQVKV